MDRLIGDKEGGGHVFYLCSQNTESLAKQILSRK